MKEQKNTLILVFLIFFIGLLVRFLPAIAYDYPIGIDSYYHIRISEQMLSEGLVSYDPLSFGGRPHLYPPGMHLLLAGTSLVSGVPVELATEIVPTVIGALSIVAIFFVTRKLYGEKVAIMAALFLAFAPVHIWKTASNGLVSAVDITLLLVSFYFLLEKKYVPYFVLVVILGLFSPLVAIFAVLLGLFETLYENKYELRGKRTLSFKSQKKNKRRAEPLPLATKRLRAAEKVFIIFFLVAMAGLAAFSPLVGDVYITKELPNDIRMQLYEKPSFADLLYRMNPVMIIGIIGLILSWRKHNRTMSFWFIFVAILTAVDFIETDRGLFYLSVPLSIITAKTIADLKLPKKYTWLGLVITFIIAIVTVSIGIGSVNSLSWSAPTNEEIDALTWISSNTPQDSVVLATLQEGHWVSAVAERKNVIDPNLIGAPNLGERYQDVKTIYTTKDSSLRKSLIDKYSIDYVVFSGWPYNIGGTVENFAGYEKVFEKGPVRVFKVN